MAFAMRMTFADVIKGDTIKPIEINGELKGLEFEVQLGYYRGQYLSTIDKLEVTLDGTQIDQVATTLTLKEREMPIYQVKEAYTMFWSQVENATIKLLLPEGINSGEHELKLDLMLRIPYMNIGPGKYMPLDSGDTVSFVLEGGTNE